ncbi:hypothetical protein P12x_002736 [Tundrisphaera lichenicola]|uniref:hypothetical protein n=1 Tax=Tundrisphaera lichenicola TaxID=2029860 RepID=UPI003EB83689
MDKPSLAELMTAPLILLERTKGWKRRALVFLYLIILLMTGAYGWHSLCLWRLPDAPEPFDLAKYGRVEVPDADNAMVGYREVVAKFGDFHLADYKLSDWSVADAETRRWAEEHRKALEAWLPANDRPDSLLLQPEALRMRSDQEPLQRIRPYVRLALLEASRLEESGDLAGAWRMYRAVLRASRHVGRHGGAIQRLIGTDFLRQSRPRVEAWIGSPGMTADLLRRATVDVEECRAMTLPASEMVRAEYFSALDAMNDTDRWSQLSDTGPYSNVNWYNQFAAGRWIHRFLRREPERSARVLRLITAGYLAQSDRPPALRPRMPFPQNMIYDHDAQTPPAVRSITPEALDAWARNSVLESLNPFSRSIQALVDAEPGTFDRLALMSAERAFEIERGRLPRTYGELLGPYLKALPDGLEPGDLANPE